MKNLEKENKKMNKLGVASLVGLSSIMIASANPAAPVAANITAANSGDVGFENLFHIFENWLSGNLGKLLALIGFARTFIVYMMTHKGSVLMIGVIISLIAGGMVGISGIFFHAGTSSFGNTLVPANP